MIKHIPLLNDTGALLSYRVTIPPAKLGWVLCRHGDEIRPLNRFESNFVDSAVAAATLQHEAAETQALTERDTAEEQRDQLVSKLAGYLGLDFGEHSSANDPWQNAMDALDEKPPATPQLAVWFGPMPESNGKVNWTAILYRKEANTFLSGVGDGYTLARSEYTDRVRYEADRVRFLIGELATPPWILDYDSELNAPADYKVKT